jgi:hypothetical protein
LLGEEIRAVVGSRAGERVIRDLTERLLNLAA